MKYKIPNWNNINVFDFNENEEIFLLGIKIQLKLKGQKDQKIQIIINYFKNIIWMTYRKNFPPLLQNIFGPDFISDTGWGCMLRVGQMMFAQALKKHIFYEKIKNNIETTIPPINLKKIIIGFIDDDKDSLFEGQYSIQKIAKTALKEFHLKPGTWFNPSNIAYTLERLHSNNRLKDSENLEFVIFNDGMVFLDKMLNKIEISKCQCDEFEYIMEKSITNSLQKDKENLYEFIDIRKSDSDNPYMSNSNDSCEFGIIDKPCSEEDSIEMIKSENFQNTDKLGFLTENKTCLNCKNSSKSLYVIIIAQIGLDEPNPDYLEVIDEMFKIQYSLGVAGGKPDSALYFIGLKGEKYFYLDPHYVQNYTSIDNIDINLNTYFCDNIRCIDKKQISPSLALGFYLRNAFDVKYFYYSLKNLSKKYGDRFFLGLEESSNEYDDIADKLIFRKSEKNLEENDSWEIIEK